MAATWADDGHVQIFGGQQLFGHAADLFRNRAALRDKIRRAECIICISTFHRDFYLRLGARPEQLHIAYCGIDPALFTPCTKPEEPRDVYRIIAAGRLVEKKGFEYLVDACRLLADRGDRFTCAIAGSGELEGALRQRILDRGLEQIVNVTGEPLTQEQIPAFMHSGDLFCLPCVWAHDNDADGLPQLLMEAMACGIPVISTRMVGIPDLIIHDETGALVEPRDSEGLADEIRSLMHEPHRADRLARAGRAWVLKHFDLANSLDPLVDFFAQKVDMTPRGRQQQRGTDPTISTQPAKSGLEVGTRP